MAGKSPAKSPAKRKAPTWAHTGIRRALQLRLCRTCHAPVLSGLDAEFAARNACVDPTPIDAVGEYLALAAGRETYDLVPRGAGKQLDYRFADHITTRRRYPVFAEHRCGAPQLPGGWPKSDPSRHYGNCYGASPFFPF